MAFDAHANLAIATVAVAPSPATSGTSITVAAGEGARFPAAPFNATVWPAAQLPTPVTAEVVRITARSGDVLTIARAQEATGARTIVAGDLIAATITAKTITDIETATAPPWLSAVALLPAGWTGTYTYTIAGATMSVVLYASGTLAAPTVPIPFSLPRALATGNLTVIGGAHTAATGAWATAQGFIAAAGTTLDVYPVTGTFPGGAITIALLFTVPV